MSEWRKVKDYRGWPTLLLDDPESTSGQHIQIQMPEWLVDAILRDHELAQEQESILRSLDEYGADWAEEAKKRVVAEAERDQWKALATEMATGLREVEANYIDAKGFRRFRQAKDALARFDALKAVST